MGHADRACFNLRAHSSASGMRFAERWYDEPRLVRRLHKTLNKKAIGQCYKRQRKPR